MIVLLIWSLWTWYCLYYINIIVYLQPINALARVNKELWIDRSDVLHIAYGDHQLHIFPWMVVVSFNTWRLEPSYSHMLPVSRSIFSNNSEYIISQELPPWWSRRCQTASLWRWLPMEKLCVGDCIFSVDNYHHGDISLHHILEGRFSHGTPLGMKAMYWRFLLLASLLPPLVSSSKVFEGDLPLGGSSISIFPFDILGQTTFLNEPFDDIL